jgi:hypothetical protein
VSLQSRWKDEFCIWVILDESRGRKSLDGLIVEVRLVHTAASAGRAIAVLHAAPGTTGFLELHTGLVNAECLSGVQDRTVAGTTAQVAVKGFLDVIFRRGVVIP